MAYTPNRRTVLVGLSSLAVGGVGGIAYTDTSQATSIQIDKLEIPDKEKQISNPVNGVSLEVNGSFSYETSVNPSKIILRLEGKTSDNNSYTQLEAEKFTTHLEKTDTKEFSFNGNLLDLNNLNAPDLTPAEIGQTKSQTIDIRLTLSVYNDGTKLKEKTVKDSSTLNLTRKQAGVEAYISATGNISVSTS